MTELMRRRRELMAWKKDENWINILIHTDWKSDNGFVYARYRSMSQQMIPTNNASTVRIPCPFESSGSFSRWQMVDGGIIIREYDDQGNYVSTAAAWGSNADTSISLDSGTSFIRVGFQRGGYDSATPDNWALYHPLTINSVAYNTEFNGQKVKA